jgi:trigger factor
VFKHKFLKENQVEVKIEKLDDNRLKITAEVDVKTVDGTVKRTYTDIARRYNFPGFRKGKAPRPVIDNAIGREAVLAQATEDVINAAYPAIIEQENLFPQGQPTFGEAGMVEPGKAFSFDFEISTKPEVELSSYEPVEIELPEEEATEAEMNEQIDALLSHYKTSENANAATKFKKENTADLVIKATKEDGSAVDSISEGELTYTPGVGLLPESFDAEVLGMKKGENRTFELELAQDEQSVLLSSVAGQKISFDVTCSVVKKTVTPTLTDEWVKETLGFDDVASLRKRMEDEIAQQKAQIMPTLKENACAIELAKRVDIEAPEAMAEQAEQNLLQDFFTQLQRRGITFDAYLASRGIDNTQFTADIKKQAQDEAKKDIALDAWAKNAGIEATEEDVLREFVLSGAEDPKKLMEEWRKNGRLYLIREGILRGKAMENVLETAKITRVDFTAKAK